MAKVEKDNNEAVRHEPKHEQDFKPAQETLISFESGHYKAFKGEWQGDSVWAHFKTADGRVIHVNKDKVEYIQTRG